MRPRVSRALYLFIGFFSTLVDTESFGRANCKGHKAKRAVLPFGNTARFEEGRYSKSGERLMI
jgi:hypothetical protein